MFSSCPTLVTVSPALSSSMLCLAPVHLPSPVTSGPVPHLTDLLRGLRSSLCWTRCLFITPSCFWNGFCLCSFKFKLFSRPQWDLWEGVKKNQQSCSKCIKLSSAREVLVVHPPTARFASALWILWKPDCKLLEGEDYTALFLLCHP